jgi:hypothetical protein
MIDFNWKVTVPDAVSPCGNVKIETFEISKDDADFNNCKTNRLYWVSPGKFKRLIIDNDVVMSNTKMEVRTNRTFVSKAKGKVLINGLGLGMVLEQLLEKHKNEGCIEHITVIEKDPRVIALVGTHYANNPLITIIEADALEYRPPKGVRYGAVWHDIWTFITADNIKDMKALHRRYGRRTDWQGSWARDECEYQRNNSYW